MIGDGEGGLIGRLDTDRLSTSEVRDAGAILDGEVLGICGGDQLGPSLQPCGRNESPCVMTLNFGGTHLTLLQCCWAWHRRQVFHLP